MSLSTCKSLLSALIGTWCCQLSLAQVPPVQVMSIDVQNTTSYSEDVTDISQYATNPNPTPRNPGRNFWFLLEIKDIVAVNGHPAKGTYISHDRTVNFNPTPAPGGAIADTLRNSQNLATFEILSSDGNPIGMIAAVGLSNGSPPGLPGDAPQGGPVGLTQANFAITGGTGAYLALRGQYGQTVTATTVSNRAASVTEDPANRRANGGGRQRYLLKVIPADWPRVVRTTAGAACFHADSSLVTADNPAASGELLTVQVTGLGPTVPVVDPGHPFPVDSVTQVNSPVDVTVNGQPAEVVTKVGWPGLVDTYRVDFRVPDATASGISRIQLSAAWIAGETVNIAIK